MRAYRCLLSMTLAIAACDSSGSGGVALVDVATRDSAGITIVENTVAEPTDVALWTVDTTPARTIGATTGDPAYEFARLGGLLQLSNGMILALNGRGENAFEFRFFDSTGKHVATHGRLGQGPGEYRWIEFVGSVSGDTVVAVDFPNARLNWLSASRGYLRSSRLDENSFRKLLGDDASGIIETMVPLGDSTYAVEAIRQIPNGSDRPRRAYTFHIVDLAANTEVAATVRYEDPPSRMVETSVGAIGVWPANAGRVARVVDRARERICGATSNLAEISCVDAKGHRLVIRWATTPVPYTSEDRRADDELTRRMWMNARGANAQDVEKLIAARESPEHYHPITALQMDSDGNFWILENSIDSGGARRERFRIIDAEGKHRAFATPFPARNVGLGIPLYIGDRAVLRAIENADGAQVIGVFPIHKP